MCTSTFILHFLLYADLVILIHTLKLLKIYILHPTYQKTHVADSREIKNLKLQAWLKKNIVRKNCIALI
jgi:hypothetical protein